MSQPTGLYGWIRSNDGRSIGLFVAFVGAIQVAAAMVLFLPLALQDRGHAPFFDWGGYLSRYAPMVLAASIIWFFSQLFWHIETVKRAVGFEFVDDEDEPRLCRIIEPLIIMTGLPTPYVGVIESDARNAFACGIARKKAVVVVTRGLLDSLDDKELACVLAHELSHIKNGDIRLMAAANIFVSALAKLHRRNPLKFTPVHLVLAIAVPAILPLSLVGGLLGHLALRAGQVARLLIASSREFIADAEAVQLTKNPAALAAALVKVEHHFRVDTARHEDDAMMIAGDTEGQDATHPTIAQRVAALARTTGSMVFNAPGALSPQVWEDSTSLSEAKAAALLRRLPPTRALPRVRAGANVNVLGLSRLGTFSMLATILSLLWIHAAELRRPDLIMAKFDLRPLSILLGSPSCLQMPSPACARDHANAYKDFEGQKNTLAGYLADESHRRRAAGFAHPDITLDNPDAAAKGEPYPGQSGQLKGVFAVKTQGAYQVPGMPGAFQSQVPEPLLIAEVNAVGCFPSELDAGEGHGDGPQAQFATEESWLNGYRSDAAASTIVSGEPGSPDHDAWLKEYAAKREQLLQDAYFNWGRNALAVMLAVYGEPQHEKVLAELRSRGGDPRFFRGETPLSAAKLRAFMRDPAKFIPCSALRTAARTSAGT